MIVKREVDEKFEEKIAKMKERFEDLKQEMSDIRKAGKNTKFAEVYVLNIMPKLKMALNTYDKSDMEKAKKWLDEYKKEIEAAKKGDAFEHDLGRIHDAYAHIYKKKKKEAVKIYNSLRKSYKKYTAELRRLVYHACLDMHRMLVKK